MAIYVEWRPFSVVKTGKDTTYKTNTSVWFEAIKPKSEAQAECIYCGGRYSQLYMDIELGDLMCMDCLKFNKDDPGLDTFTKEVRAGEHE